MASNTFREQLREAMDRQGVTVPELSRRTGIPTRTIESWRSDKISGRTPPEYVQQAVLDAVEDDER